MIRYAITDGKAGLSQPEMSPPQAHRLFLQRCAQLAAQGVNYLLIREKHLHAKPLLALTRQVVTLCRGTQTIVLVSGRPDIALAAAAAGVNLSASPADLTPAQLRIVFPAALLSRSCHTPAQVRAAAASGVDLILFGPVFGKLVAGQQVVPAAGLHALSRACDAAQGVPVLALGGISPANAANCLAAGAAGIAAIRMYFGTAS